MISLRKAEGSRASVSGAAAASFPAALLPFEGKVEFEALIVVLREGGVAIFLWKAGGAADLWGSEQEGWGDGFCGSEWEEV